MHTAFGFLNLRSAENQDDRLIEFCALSYAWGSQDRSRELLCNNKQIRITTNLHQALSAIRKQDYGTQHLWVDAICINQDDEKEKAAQVSRMLEIYQLAKHVIAWLGDPGTSLEDVKVATRVEASRASLATTNLQQVARGAEWLYSAPWFGRLWVQQELFASKFLRFLCGVHDFSDSALLSKPQEFEHFLTDQDRSVDFEIFRARSGSETAETLTAPIPLKFDSGRLLNILSDGAGRLHCYRQFFLATNVDLIEALLYTGNTEASNPLGFIYGVLGLSGFPALAISLQIWLTSKAGARFVPIDYSADFESLNSVLSRILLFRMGLGLLAKFKVIRRGKADVEAGHDELPSWTIDWRLTSSVFILDRHLESNLVRKLDTGWDVQSTDYLDGDVKKLDNRWDVQSTNYSYDEPITDDPPSRRSKLYEWPQPPSHTQFCNTNMVDHLADIRSLRLEGRVCSKAIIDPSRNTVEIKLARRKRPKRIFWHPQVQLQDDDIVVSFSAFARADYTGGKIVTPSTAGGTMTKKPFILAQPDLDTLPYENGGLWILRSAQNVDFRLVACLSMIGTPKIPPYESWGYDEALVQGDSNLIPLMVRQTRNPTKSPAPISQRPHEAIEALLDEPRMFVIV